MLHTSFSFTDHENYIELAAPKEFSFNQCMVYLNRSELECLHKVKDNEIYKLLKLDGEYILIKISSDNTSINVSFLNSIPSKEKRSKAAKYVWEMYDLDTDISQFYKSINDAMIKKLIDKYYGLRIIKINDLFEGLCWAIIGQQINLKFAYTLKKRFTEKFGESINFNGEDYWLFPTPDIIAGLDIAVLKELQFTGRKAEYLIGLAKLFADKKILKQELDEEADYSNIKEKLLSIRGIGGWTADYTIMKCFKINNALPIADVGLHNAIKNILKLDKKPSIAEIEKMAEGWKGWESYATFYLWRSLYD